MAERAPEDGVPERRRPSPVARDRPRPSHGAALQETFETVRRVDIAVGIVMESLEMTDEAAMTLLVRAAQRSNRSLRDIAEGVIEPGRRLTTSPDAS